MQFKCGVIVVGVAVHPLVHHCHMAIDLLSPFLQRPVLSTLPSTALICPAAQRQDILNQLNVLHYWKLVTSLTQQIVCGVFPILKMNSNYLVVMTMTRTFCSQTILQKSLYVLSSGPTQYNRGLKANLKLH